MANEYFDLVTLIKLGDFDIRRVVRNNLTQKVGEFFEVLSKFINEAQNGLNSIYRIVDVEATEVDLQVLADMMEQMENIGAIKNIPALEDTIKAGKRGHSAFASDCAKKLAPEFDKLKEKVESTKRTGAADALVAADFINLTLKEALAKIEQDENTRKLRILAVDDAPVMIKTISSVLEPEYKVYGLTNPMMVEKFLGQITPELFLLDYEMPEMNGFDLIPYIRQFEEHKNTPIVFLTSIGTMETVSAAATLGACDFIVKPFQADNLKEKVAKHIIRKKLVF
jgi:PleD family two-component response regulator